MTPEERQPRPRRAYVPFERPPPPAPTARADVRINRSISINELHNLPVEQQQPAHMNEKQWMRYIAEEIDQARRPEIDQARRPEIVRNKTIFSVPRALSEVRPRSYCPFIVTIGPLCRKLEPSPMDGCKALCIREFMARRGTRLDELVDHIIPDPENLENVYFGAPNYSIETLKLLLTMDSVFIHEFLFFFSRSYSPTDEICGYLSSFLNNQITISQATRDLFLIGNQVPIWFFRRITELPINEDLTVDELLLHLELLVWENNPFCMGSTPSHNDFKAWIRGTSFLYCEHLLDCLYISCVKEESPQEFNRTFRGLRTASELSKVGIKFKACKGNTSVVGYEKKSLSFDLPKLIVYDVTEDIFRNLIAYEQTSKAGGELCGYAIIMDSLIDTVEDLKILYRAGVLENNLGSDERLLQMWNDMCINISDSSCDRWKVMTDDILMHYKSNWRVMYVEFYEKFFSRPWLLISTIAALLLLGMSALQTIYTVAAYYHG